MGLRKQEAAPVEQKHSRGWAVLEDAGQRAPNSAGVHKGTGHDFYVLHYIFIYIYVLCIPAEAAWPQNTSAASQHP